jgi:hypothetical protein
VNSYKIGTLFSVLILLIIAGLWSIWF